MNNQKINPPQDTTKNTRNQELVFPSNKPFLAKTMHSEPPRFSLGTSNLTEASKPSPKRPLLRWLLLGTGFFLTAALGVALIFGARFTQALQFENTPISFFEGIRLIGSSVFAHPEEVKGYQDGRVNILLMGRAGKRYPGKNLTDTVMVLSLETQSKKAALLSLPRDLLAPISETNNSVKINTLYQYGLLSGDGAELIKKSVGTITGLPIHYFATIDFDGFEKVIDTLGGIHVEVLRDIRDTRYPGPNYSYETFELRKGWQMLDGKTALKYARMRHDDPEGDFGRAKRQQQILQAVREKTLSLPTILNPVILTGLLEDLGESVDTDITPEVARSLLPLVEKIDAKTVTTVVVDAWKKESLLRVVHIDTPTGRAFALSPRSGTWQEVRSLSKNIFESQLINKRRDEITREASSVLVVVPPEQTSTGQDLVQDITETFPIKKIQLKTWPELKSVTEDVLVGSTQTSIYTIDSLIGRYDLKFQETSPINLPAHFPTADLVILYTQKDIPGLIHEIPPEELGDFAEPDF